MYCIISNSSISILFHLVLTTKIKHYEKDTKHYWITCNRVVTDITYNLYYWSSMERTNGGFDTQSI